MATACSEECTQRQVVPRRSDRVEAMGVRRSMTGGRDGENKGESEVRNTRRRPLKITFSMQCVSLHFLRNHILTK